MASRIQTPDLEAEPLDRMETPPAPAAEPHAHPEHLQHHFDTPAQQFEASKLGMWLFLATEVLLFGGLFCLYTILRYTHPELFAYGSRFLDTTWGAINTTVLILSSVTMAIAVWCAQCNHQRHLIFFLLLTLLFAGDFLLIKYLEYSHKIEDNLVWGTKLYQLPPGYEDAEAAEPGPEAMLVAGGAAAEPEASPVEAGRQLWLDTCRSCHGLQGEGIPGQGKDIRGSEFILGKTDEELLSFVKVGRMPFDPLNTTGIQMPPRGGNPLLSDDDLAKIIQFLRTVVKPGGAAVEGEVVAAEEEFYVPRSVIPPAADAPADLNLAGLVALEARFVPVATEGKPAHPAHDLARPVNAHLFFGIYFLMTGLHGLHVFAGMIVIGWLLVRTLKGHFSSDYFTPVDLGGLYWHVVDLIWIFLFPLFYLI